MLDVSPGFVAAVEQARAVPAQGFIGDEELAATESWLQSPEAAALFASARRVEKIASETRAKPDQISEHDYARAAESVFPSPPEHPDPAAVPLTDQQAGELWSSSFVRELLRVSPDLQRHAGKLIQRSYNPERSEDRVDFLVELMRPGNLTMRKRLTLWIQATEFRYIHTGTPPDIARVRVLISIAHKEYERAFAPARPVAAKKALTDLPETDFTRAAGIPLAHLQQMSDELLELSVENFRTLQRQEPLSTETLEAYLKKFTTVALNFLGAAKNSSGHPTVQATIRHLIHEVIIDLRLDRMSFQDDKDLEHILTYSPKYGPDFLDTRRRLRELAGPF